MDWKVEGFVCARFKLSERRAKWNAYDNAIIRLSNLGGGFCDDRALARDVDDRAFLGQGIVLFNVSAGREGKQSARIQRGESLGYNILSLPRVADPDIPRGDRSKVTLVVLGHLFRQLTLLGLFLVLFQLSAKSIEIQRDKKTYVQNEDKEVSLQVLLLVLGTEQLPSFLDILLELLHGVL